jgi:hypothetical protein
VIVPLSCGKDSLLTLALCKDIGLDPVCVYINDTVSGTENEMKLLCLKKIAGEFGVKLCLVTNELENLNDFEFWDKAETCLGYSHMIAGFCFIALPLAHYFGAKYILLGNQYDMNYSFMNKDGYRAFPSFEQSRAGMKILNKTILRSTENRVNVTSFIDCINNLSIFKILNSRYRAYLKYEISCDALNTTRKNTRWCCNCSKCARLYIMMKATGIDPSFAGIKKNLLGKNSGKLYCLFNGSEKDSYEKSKKARDQQLLSFYLAYRNGAEGYLIDSFKRKFLKEAVKRAPALIKEFLCLHGGNTTIPAEYRKKILSIYRKELTP